MDYFYRGRHRAPSTTARTAARLAIGTTAAVALPLGLAAPAAAAPTVNWGPIIACESGGNPQASNGTHFGLFQFDLATWRSVGGTGHPLGASVAEQYKRAQLLYAQRGTQPWNASRSCWAGKSAPAPPPVKAPAKAVAPVKAPAKAVAKAAAGAVAKPSWQAAAAGYTVRPGDTLSGIAAVRGLDWNQIYQHNHETIGDNPDLIFPGQQLAL